MSEVLDVYSLGNFNLKTHAFNWSVVNADFFVYPRVDIMFDNNLSSFNCSSLSLTLFGNAHYLAYLAQTISDFFNTVSHSESFPDYYNLGNCHHCHL